MKADEFLDLVFSDKTDDEVVNVCKGIPKGEKDTIFWNMAPDGEAFQKWMSNPKRHKQAWYFCVSAVNGTLNEKGNLRRKRIDLTRYHCLVLDDIGTKASEPPVEPAWKLESSEGNFQWGYLLEPGDDWERYEALLDWASDQGWGDGGAGGSYRVMRLPNSANLKPGRDKFMAKVEWDDENAAVWTLKQLAHALGIDEGVWADYASTSGKKMKHLQGGAGVSMEGVHDPVLQWLSDHDHVVKDDGNDFIDVVCPWHEEHTTGQNTAGYSPLGRGVAPWDQQRTFRCLHEHCKERKFPEFVEWVMKEGGPWARWFDPLPFVQWRYVYVEEDCLWADMPQRDKGGESYWVLTEKEFVNRYKRKVDAPGHDRPVNITTALLEDMDTRRAARFVYDPTQGDKKVCRAHGQDMINLYIPPTHLEPPADDVPTLFLEHVAFLVPDKKERELVIDWLAFHVQRPDKRQFALCMVAEDAYGVGRTWLGKMMELVEPGSVSACNLAQLVGKGTTAEQTYNDWAARCRLVIVEEAKDLTRAEFYESYEVFKERIDNRPLKFRCNPKYGKTRTDHMYFNTMILSNHADALALPEGDRRVAVVTNPTERRDRDYYEKLQDCLNAAYAGRVWWWLSRRDISKYDHVYPPMTEAKAHMIEANRAPSDAILGHLVEEMPGDLVRQSALRGWVQRTAKQLGYDEIAQKPDGLTRMIWKKLGSMRRGNAKHGARYSVEGEQVEFRAIRGKSKWVDRDEARESGLIISEAKKNSGEVIKIASVAKAAK